MGINGRRHPAGENWGKKGAGISKDTSAGKSGCFVAIPLGGVVVTAVGMWLRGAR